MPAQAKEFELEITEPRVMSVEDQQTILDACNTLASLGSVTALETAYLMYAALIDGEDDPRLA